MSDYSIMRCSIRDRCAKQAQEIERLRMPAELVERVRCAVEDGFDDQDAHSILSDILEVIGELEKSS